MSASVLGPDSVPDVVDVLHDAFFDYPVMRFVLGEDGDYADRLRRLLIFFVRARVLRDEVLLGVSDASGLVGAALVSWSWGHESPVELSELREAIWSELGGQARARYEAFGAAVPAFEVEPGHLHLNMVGVRRRARGRGLARSLLSRVHEISDSDSGSAGVTLTTEVESNVPFYERFGYEVVGHGSVAPELETWAMYRPDTVGAGG